MKRVSLTPRLVDAVAPVLLVLLAAALGMLLLRPPLDAWRYADRERRAFERAERPLSSLKAEEASLAGEVATFREALGPIETALPPVTWTFSFLEELGRQARAERVRLNEIVPGRLVAGTGYVAIPIGLQLRGSFHALLRYLVCIERSSHLVRVDTISLTRLEGTSDMNMEARLQVFCSADPSAAGAEIRP
jgi:Tfp pilus assembly protein PilO